MTDWLRFSIRGLLWAMLVVGLCLGWWRDRERLASLDQESESWEWKAKDLATQWRRVGGTVEWYDTGNGWAVSYSDPEQK